MAFIELELKRIEKTVGQLCLRRSLAHLTQQLRLEYQVKGHEVLIVERRSRWDNPEEWGESPLAKLKFIRTVKQWQLYWQRIPSPILYYVFGGWYLSVGRRAGLHTEE